MPEAHLRAIFFASILAMAAVPAAGQQPRPGQSGDPLQEICTGFMDQSGHSVAGDRNKLCACLVRETKARLTVKEMEIYSKAGEAGQPPPTAIMEKVMGVATTCLTAAR